MEIIEIKISREKFMICYFLVLLFMVLAVRFFWGYFGVGSGTHYMYFCEMSYKIFIKLSLKYFYLVLIRNFTCFQ